MKITQMTSPRTGKPVANQFEIVTPNGTYFQSYNSIIAFIPKKVNLYDDTCEQPEDTRVQLDETYWNYSRTTAKYRNAFLGETTKETQEKINNDTYKLANLN